MTRSSVADLPGLIAGAAEHNVGLGAEFLSLIADCQLLAYVIDIGTPWASIMRSGSDLVSTLDRYTDEVTNQLVMLRHELFTFDQSLVDPDRTVVLGTKLDLALPDPNGQHSLLRQLTQSVIDASVVAEVLRKTDTERVLLVSARRGDNTEELVRRIVKQRRTR